MVQQNLTLTNVSVLMWQNTSSCIHVHVEYPTQARLNKCVVTLNQGANSGMITGDGV